MEYSIHVKMKLTFWSDRGVGYIACFIPIDWNWDRDVKQFIVKIIICSLNEGSSFALKIARDRILNQGNKGEQEASFQKYSHCLSLNVKYKNIVNNFGT